MNRISSTQAPVDRSVTAADGVPIAYRDYGGTGRGLVLIHGVGANLEATEEAAVRLGNTRHVVALDVRGCGRSGDPQRFRWADTVTDVETVAATCGLAELDVVGFSLGGIIAGHYATTHPGTRAVSVDGFGAGVASRGTAAQAAALARYMDWARTSLQAMTAPPERGDLAWKQQQIRAIEDGLRAMGYDPPHRERMIERQFTALPDGTYRRHPARQFLDDIVADAFDRDPPANILEMFRGCTGPVLIIRCTRSEWPDVLDTELDDLTTTRPNIDVVRLPLTHLGPVTDGLDQTLTHIDRFLAPTRNP
jgi:pimeloyl-ACP methyl ester carboxylesterase